MATKLHLTRNSLPAKARELMVDLLNTQLATLLDLHSQCQQAHWNVRGRGFFALHKLFEEVAGLIAPHLDVTAERVTALGGDARGTVRMAAAISPLPDYPEHLENDIEHVAALLERFAASATHVRAATEQAASHGDPGTADLLTAVSRDLDKGLWLLEAHRP
jgi:starvation-inducible DNA-binding protein